MIDPASPDRHPTPEALLAFEDRDATRLPAADRERLERHLRDCPRCRTELASLRRFDAGAAPPRGHAAPILHPGQSGAARWRRWLWHAVGLAIALVGLAMLCARGMG